MSIFGKFPRARFTLLATFFYSVALFPALWAESIPVYFGTYTRGESPSEGIYRSELDLETGRLADPVLVAECVNPSFLAIHPNGKFFYAVSESGGAGVVRAFAVEAGSGDLRALNQQPSGGSGPCHVSVDHAGKNLLVANYGSGSVSIIPIKLNGGLATLTGFVQHEGSSVNAKRQKAPHAHSINPAPDDRFAFVADLGIDKVLVYKLNGQKGTIAPNDPPFVKVKPGAGPRHFTFHPGGQFAYVINELNGTITAFAYDAAAGALSEIQTITTLPKGFQGANGCAEIRVHPSGKFLYGSNRGHDSIAVYQIDPAKGTLTFVEHEMAGIKTPRNFNIDPTGRFCLVANMGGDDVAVFRIDSGTGALDPIDQKIDIGKPVCVRFFAPRLAYPVARRSDQVDLYHGVEVADPYRWLEADARVSDEVVGWVEAQNRVTFGYLEGIPERDGIRKRLEKVWNYEKYSTPFKRGGRYYYYKNDGLQNQSVLYTMKTLESKPRVLLDPNGWSSDGTVALAGQSFSDDGRYVAYAVSEAGSDWRTFHVMDIESGKVLSNKIKWVKFSGAAWTRDSKGFFYGRFDAPEEGADFQALNLNQKIYYHRVGAPQSEDALVYHRPGEPKWGYGSQVSEDGRYLIIQVSIGTDDRCRVLYKDLSEPYGMPIDLIDNFDYAFDFLGNDGAVFYFATDFEAPRRRLIAIDTRAPERENWREIVPQRAEAIQSVSLVGNMFVCTYMKDVLPLIIMYGLDGAKVREVDFPEIGSASGFGGKRSDTETFYSFQSFATPPSTYRYDMLSGKSALLRRAKVDVKPEDYEVRQVFYASKDGTKVPMFIAHKKGLELNGSNPTLLYAYGGFDISIRPSFSVSNLAWIEMGGVYALANLRGGGEYGKEWHEAGTKLRKQNVFDDFIGAAEWLIANGYTRSDKLAIKGGSNGGLLVGAVMTQRPDLFGACLPAVGVMDMLRFHKFTAGRYWVDDYGSSDDAEEFRALFAYSPYHNIKMGARYPATLVTTADTDDRVVPMHSFKFAAALQRAQAGEAPTLIRIETRAGHGAGKPTSKRIDEAADALAFLYKNLGMADETP